MIVVQKVRCLDCNRIMILLQGAQGLYYGCSRFPECRGSVSANSEGIVSGRYIDNEIATLRDRAHKVFDKLWLGPERIMTRNESYLYLQQLTGIDAEACHISQFDVGQCSEVLEFLL